MRKTPLQRLQGQQADLRDKLNEARLDIKAERVLMSAGRRSIRQARVRQQSAVKRGVAAQEKLAAVRDRLTALRSRG